VVDQGGVARPVNADWYVCAIPCEKLAAALRADVVAADPKLGDVTKGHVNYVDSAWAITSISQEQFWKRPLTSYGDGTVKDCLSSIISDWSTQGNFNGKSARDCTPHEIAGEAWAQIKAHLNDTGHVVDDGMLDSWFLDPAIIDSGTPGVRNDEPLFIQDPGSWARRPEATTAIDNLFLAGEWVKTNQNVTTMEGANEGGRYAANGVLLASGYRGSMVKIVELFKAPWWARPSRLPIGPGTVLVSPMQSISWTLVGRLDGPASASAGAHRRAIDRRHSVPGDVTGSAWFRAASTRRWS
jgi:hypothetical protein